MIKTKLSCLTRQMFPVMITNIKVNRISKIFQISLPLRKNSHCKQSWNFKNLHCYSFESRQRIFCSHVHTSSWLSKILPIVQQKLKSWKVLWQHYCYRRNREIHLSFSTIERCLTLYLTWIRIYLILRQKNSWIPNTKQINFQQIVEYLKSWQIGLAKFEDFFSVYMADYIFLFMLKKLKLSKLLITIVCWTRTTWTAFAC